MELGSLSQRQYFECESKQKKCIQKYPRETLYLRWVNDKCFKILKMFNDNETKYEDIFCSSKAKELTKILKDFLQVKMRYKFQNISKIKFEYFDVNCIEILEERMDDLRDLYVDPDSYEFDEESYELNIDIQFPGYRELLKLICLFNDKIEKEEPIINLFPVIYSDSDSD